MDVNSFVIGYNKGKASAPAGGTVAEKDVNFYDYDGTLLYSYTVEEAQKLTSLPKLPEQPGLICQEWNWTLDEIKTHNGNADVGATYVTDDGSTRLYVEMPDGLTTFKLILDGYSGTIDWGDGSSVETFAGGRKNLSHTYAHPGEYVISVKSDNLLLGRNSSSYNLISDLSTSNYALFNTLKKVELGASMGRIDSDTFEQCNELKSITIPKNTRELSSYAFKKCQKLSSVILPRGIGTIGSYCFDSCYTMKTVSIGNGTTSIGNYAFQNCYNLASITLPDSVTSIGTNAFYYTYGFENVSLSNGLTSIDANAFANCYGLRSITIPNSVSSIGNNAFSTCTQLVNVTIPNSVTTMGTYAFAGCYGLSKIAMPSGVTTISNYIFRNCKGLKIVDFTSHSEVPVLSNINSFDGLPTDYEIRVPVSLYDSWKSATNWSGLAYKIVGV